MLSAVLTVVLTAILTQETKACIPTVVAPKGFRLDTPTDIYIDFHNCNNTLVTVGATLSSFPSGINHHDQNLNLRNTNHGNQPLKITLTAKSEHLEKNNGRFIYKASLSVTFCQGQNCGGRQMTRMPARIVALNKTRGYAFLTTERPAYRPGEEVNWYLGLTDQNLKVGEARLVTFFVMCEFSTSEGKERFAVTKIDKQVNDGFRSAEYKLPSDPVLGVWWIEAHVDGEKMAEKSFLIDRYALPTFQVQIKPHRYFLLPTQQYINGTLTAEYSYGEKITGSYYMSFRLRRNDGTETEFHKVPSRFGQQARIAAGSREFAVGIDKLKRILKKEESLEIFAKEGDARIVILASVTGSVESVYESDRVDNIIFTQSPFIIDYAKSPRFYVPHTIYKLSVTVRDVVHHLPVSGVNVSLAWRSGSLIDATDENGEIYHEIDSFTANVESITIQTKSDEIGDQDQARAKVSVSKYRSNKQLDMKLNEQVAKVGERQHVTFDLGTESPKTIRIYVVSRGQMVLTGSKLLTPDQRGEVSWSFKVTAAMVPHARVVAYYRHGNKFTSNSAFFDVVNKCEKELVIKPKKEEIEPVGDAVATIEVTGATKVEFLLSAVDRAAYFVHNGTRLTRDKLWKKMAEYDTACSAQGGTDAINVFEEAGLSFSTIGSSKNYPSMYCLDNNNRRKRRNAPQVPAADDDSFAEKCAKDGRVNTYGVPCDVRTERILKNKRKEGKSENDIEKCIERFLAICRSRRETSYLARANADAQDGYDDVKKRKDFAESWIFNTYTIKEKDKMEINRPIRDSITTFDLDAFGMSKQHPMCIAESKSIKVFKNCFIKVYLPYSVKVREQTMIRFSVFNYGDEPKKIKIFARHSQEICSKLRRGEFTHLETMTVGGNTEGRPSGFAIMPLKVPDQGTADIEIKIPSCDHVVRKLLIEESGQYNESSQTLLLIPDKDSSTKKVCTENIVFDLPSKGVMQNTQQCSIYAYSHPMGPNIKVDEFSGRLENVGNLVGQPGGCGEQNMLTCGPNIFVHEYRMAVWGDEVTPAQTDQVIKNIEGCYAVQLTHLSDKVQRRAFAVYHNRLPSTWLTAFVTKVFAAGQKIHTRMDTKPLCRALGWLLSMQEGDGKFGFGEKSSSYLTSQVDEPVSLAAYVAISLQESTRLCPDLAPRMTRASYKAISYVKRNGARVSGNTNRLAIIAYALSIIDPTSREAREWNELLRSRKRTYMQYIYWNGNRGTASDIETTGYALLTEISLNGITEGNLDQTNKIANWIIMQRNSNGGFKSTQDTVVALQALAKYMTVLETSTLRPPATNLEVTLTAKSNDSDWRSTVAFNLNNGNRFVDKPVPQPTIADGAEVCVSGVGTGSLSYRCTWRQHAEDGKCDFHIIISIEDDPDGAEKVKILKVNVTKPEEPVAQMSIIDVGLLTGYVPDENSLKKLCADEVVDGAADRYEITLNTVKFYLSDIDSKGVQLNFKIEEKSASLNPQSASVSAYDYYEPDIRCTKFYNLEGTHKIQTACQKSEGEQQQICKCLEGACPVCRTRQQQLTDTICSHDRKLQAKCTQMCKRENRIDCYSIHKESCSRAYVYVVTVLEVGEYEMEEYTYFKAKVDDVFRYTAAHDQANGTEVTFIMSDICFGSCRDDRYEQIAQRQNRSAQDYITKDRVLLVFGTRNPVKDKNSNTYIYELDDGGHLEEVIPASKCFCGDNDKKCRKRLSKKGKKDICGMTSILRESHNRGCDVN